MIKQTKQAAQYKYPEQCCGYCSYSYRNSYGDNQCTALIVTDNVVDIGGICNLFTTEEVEDMRPVEQQCSTCNFFMILEDGRKMCVNNGGEVMSRHICKSWRVKT